MVRYRGAARRRPGTSRSGRVGRLFVKSLKRAGKVASLSLELAKHDFDAPCPRCEYPVWVVWAEVIAGVSLICPCCRVGIRLIDDGGSVQVAPRRMQEALESLEGKLRGTF